MSSWLSRLLGLCQSSDDIIARIKKQVEAVLPDVFRIFYDPAFPKPDGSSISWFQIVFAVGPGGDAAVRASIHTHFETLLDILITNKVHKFAEHVSLRARRRTDESPPDRPSMYIEADWTGDGLRAANAADWHRSASRYVNWFDDNDPLNKSESEYDGA